MVKKMKARVLGMLLVGFFASCYAVSGEPDGMPALRYHFIGATQLSADTNANKLGIIWNLPATRDLRDQTVRKLAGLPRFLYAARFGNASDNAELMRPLLEDLLTAESCGEYDIDARQQWSWVLAVRLTQARAGVWGSNLKESFQKWNFGAITSIQVEGQNGWEIRQQNGAAVFRYVRVGSWCLLGMGTDGVSKLAGMARAIVASGRPKICETEGWLAGDVDFAKLTPKWPLADYIPFLPTNAAPSLSFQMTSKADNVRTKAVVRYPEAPTWILENWKIPTETIRDPLIAFTAMQGIAPWMERQEWVKRYEIKPVPNQACFWAFPQVPFQTCGAVPMPQADKAMDRLAAQLIPAISTNLGKQHLGDLRYHTNTLFWVDLSIVGPSLRSVAEPSGEYLTGTLFPVFAFTNPAPAELFGQIIGRTNLLYYDWELTQERVVQARVIGQLFDIFMPTVAAMPEPPQRTNDFGNAWITAIAPRLGNTVTEALVTSPKEISITRKSPVGLSSLEIVLLTRWLDNPDFPWPGMRSIAAGKVSEKASQ